MQPKVLIIDDDPAICASLSLAIEPHYPVAFTMDPTEGLERIRGGGIQVVLLDVKIGSCDGLTLLKQIKAFAPQVAIIMITAFGSIRSSVEAMKSGAFTYLSKPLDIEELLIFIRQALEFCQLHERVHYLSEELHGRSRFFGMIGKSTAMQDIYALIEKLGRVDSSVIITGESGTGKELAARAIHSGGKRRDQPFVAVNCAAIPAALMEEEFFGHKRGAFTGAVNDRKGRLEAANQGTLFLDEIGDLPLEMQGKLLRVLQQREFTPIGTNEPRKLDVRVLGATNRDLREMVRQGTFREDLYYRLNVVGVHLPPLRERREDIPLLYRHFIEMNNKEQGFSIRGVANDAERALLAYAYPGNIRELSNAIEYAAILAVDKEWIELADLPEQFHAHPAQPVPVGDLLAGMTLREVERAAITASYRRHGGRQREILAELDISERNLRNKIKSYGLDR